MSILTFGGFFTNFVMQNYNSYMKAADVNMNLIETYFGLLKNLSPDSKLELIARLSKSMKTTKKAKNDSLESLFGAFISDHSAEELINEFKKARNFDSERVEL